MQDELPILGFFLFWYVVAGSFDHKPKGQRVGCLDTWDVVGSLLVVSVTPLMFSAKIVIVLEYNCY